MKESKKGFIVTNSKNEVIGFMESYDLIETAAGKNWSACERGACLLYGNQGTWWPENQISR